MVFIKPTIVRDGVTMEGIAGRKYNYFRALQLEQQQRGINLMPNTSVPVMDELKTGEQLPPEVNDILERYKNGQALATPKRESEPALRAISGDKKQDGSDHE
jgi:general secretion pathway protein D